MQKIANILLIENSTAGNPPKSFEGQHVKITHKNDTVIQSLEGHVSKGRHPSNVLWLGGRANDFNGITNVKITAIDGNVLLDGELNTFYGRPTDIDEGVEFFVLISDS
ncbi:hypothetical protein [Methyloglobulus sp.]|uniref:hypothetical protein n=1 Tax=Methyloglobulus sp. TaxID=2518622 RepID=UPI0032B809A5